MWSKVWHLIQNVKNKPSLIIINRCLFEKKYSVSSSILKVIVHLHPVFRISRNKYLYCIAKNDQSLSKQNIHYLSNVCRRKRHKELIQESWRMSTTASESPLNSFLDPLLKCIVHAKVNCLTFVHTFAIYISYAYVYIM